MRSVAAILLLASAARFAWESRSFPPVLVPDSTVILPRLLAASESLAADAALRSQRLIPGETLDPNVASAVDWDRLPGIGAVMADRIIETRTELGGFSAVEELGRVPGIGPRTLEELLPFLEAPSPRSRVPASQSAVNRAVNLNTATVLELQSLPGIGPVLAERIVGSRIGEGAFRSVEEVMRVPGIGAVVFGQIREMISVRSPY